MKNHEVNFACNDGFASIASELRCICTLDAGSIPPTASWACNPLPDASPTPCQPSKYLYS